MTTLFGKFWRWAKHVSLFRQDFLLLGEMHLERSRRFTGATRRAAGIRQFIRLRKPRQAAADPQIRCLEVLQNEKFREMTFFFGSKFSKVLFEKKSFRPQDANRRFHRRFNKNMNAKTGGFIRYLFPQR